MRRAPLRPGRLRPPRVAGARPGAFARPVLLTLCALLGAAPATALELQLPASARETGSEIGAPDSFAVPIGAWDNGILPALSVEGRVERRAWRLRARGLTTLQILTPLRDQLTAAGFEPIFECRDRGCGGFDFRYALDVLPAPAMYVDIFDYRLVTLRRARPEGVSYAVLLVSRTEGSGFVQLVSVAPEGSEPVTASTDGAGPGPDPVLDPDADPDAGPDTDPAEPPPVSGPLAQRLERDGHVVLDDLVFSTGSSELDEGTYASLTALGVWLKADPARRVALVGHTDAEGTLENNIALSRRRAESVLERMISRHGVAREQMEAQGVGYLSPLASNAGDAGRIRNRRVEAVSLNTGG